MIKILERIGKGDVILMSDGITDAIKACKEEERWEKIIHPYIKNHLIGLKPEQLTPQECHWMWIHYRKMESRRVDEIRNEFREILEPWWDAYIGQGDFKHYRYKKKLKVKRK